MSIIYLVFILSIGLDSVLLERHVHRLDTCSSRNSTLEMTSILWRIATCD